MWRPPSATATVAAAPAEGAGPQPGPSPTWVLNYLPTPLAAVGPSKLGFHVTGNGGDMIDFAAAAQPSLMKGVEEIAYLEGVKQVSPGTVTVGRYIVDDWQHNVGSGDPVAQAKAFVADQLPRYQEHAAYVDYWEGYNEIGVDKIAWYAEFEAARACEMQQHGMRAAIGSWSTGVPEPFQFEDFMPAIDAAIQCDAVLSLHEYGAPTYYLWWSQGLPPGPWYPEPGSARRTLSLDISRYFDPAWQGCPACYYRSRPRWLGGACTASRPGWTRLAGIPRLLGGAGPHGRSNPILCGSVDLV